MRIKLGIPMSTKEFALGAGGKLLCDPSIDIRYISTDSREAKTGDLFIALPGKQKSGEQFVNEAINSGAIPLSSTAKTGCISVTNVGDSLLKIASYYCKNLPYLLYNIGITGSVGKTTTKEFLKIILSQRFRVHASEGNFNNEIGLPLSILSAPKDTQILIMEMGMNHPGEIHRLSDCLIPDLGIITNIGRAHIGNLGSREAIAKAKLEILSGMKGGELFIPLEEELLSHIGNKITVSTESLEGNYSLINDACEGLNLYHNKDYLYDINFALKEKHHINCLAFAVALSDYLGLTEEDVRSGVSSISSFNTRQKLIIKDNLHFLTDYYNASPESMLACIDSSSKIKKYSYKSLLLGDMLELGKASGAIHYEIGKAISKEAFHNIFLFGNFSEYIYKGAINNGFPTERIFINGDRSLPEITAKHIKQYSLAGELIIMKASRAMRLERVLEYFD